jgi:predicted XRE-type DNA-binding protein
MQEIWKQYNDTKYSISTSGGFRNNMTGLILKPNLKQYSQISFNGITRLIHRLVAETFIENPENKPQVNHLDGNRHNNHVSNLEWCTQSENQIHAFETGLQISVKGEEHFNAKLNNEDVLEIKYLLETGKYSGPEIAEVFGVNQQIISKINKGHRWSHITGWTVENRNHVVVDYGKFISKHLSKLLAEDILDIRKMFKDGKGDVEIAKLYHVHKGTINSIRNGKTWKNY